MKKKILLTFGTRPEAIKMAPVYFALKKEKYFDVRLALTGQHTEILDEALRIFSMKPEYNLNIMTARQTLAQITSKAVRKLDEIYKFEKPDFVFVHGDTTTTLAASLAAFYNGIPAGHVEAGLRTNVKNEPYPEEMNRVLTDRICDLLFAPTPTAKRNLLSEGLSPRRIFVTGNTIVDSVKMMKRKIRRPKIRNFILFTMHRRESWGVPMREIFRTLRKFASRNRNIKIVYPVHPNPVVMKPAKEILGECGNIKLSPPVDYLELLSLLMFSEFIVTDSGGIQEEAVAFGKRVFLLRRVTERPEGVETGFVKIVGLDGKKLEKELNQSLEFRRKSAKIKKVNPYGDGQAATRISAVIRKFFGFGGKMKEFGG